MNYRRMQYCARCTYPFVTVNLAIDDEGVCASCRTAEEFDKLTPEFWAHRRAVFEKNVEAMRKDRRSDYDCIIPVSGGKDSYFQTHIMVKEYGLKPLLVTYHGNNYLPEGNYNRDRMREVFDCDHLVMGPSVEVLKKLNRLCFRKMGDMNWHAHCGIFTFPIQMAVKFDINLMVWGEIAWDISGMYEPDDFVEFSARVRHEHGLRGFEWYDMLNDPQEPLKENDLLWAKYPSDDQILKTGVRGLYIGNFFKWDPYKHTQLMKDLYGWKESERPFDRTYRRASNLDDRYENGIHDLLKFVKFGYGRGSDHSSKDVRTGYMTREEAIEMVRKYDHVVSDDLYYWLDYVNMTEEEFWRTADRFRDPRVWWIENGKWYKDNIWGDSSAYGEVHLSLEEQKRYQRG
ncbi:N-acetyl sugar amidotransferase [Pseudoduganella albidiflava]|uniref:Flagellin modification protein, PseA n=1 Tax=Pseudoduganella albidiflava TaxID=321983 RepID=A0A411X6U8_9BURK|nr:N-acetyl sugar amidotransferase [Pseudoduganella albidiflava]QBI04642.1 N-acetyl sugar amidotransferase [Pseudoduganella albidiflava]GGY28884.1 flagellin modification protein, PseA [Pseudoduganella albidiflava]